MLPWIAIRRWGLLWLLLAKSPKQSLHEFTCARSGCHFG
jgi:hypothetical protein